MKKRTIIIFIFCIISICIIFLLIYSVWNRLDPEYTCISCHEISPSHQSWKTSVHAGIHCTECHGTALSEGYYSLKEKTNMIYTHITQPTQNRDIHLTEKQVLSISQKCIECHRDEGAKWQNSTHAATYQEIFMDSIHNQTEPPYADCFRCHGMYYDNDITTLIDYSDKNGQIKIKDLQVAERPTIPCLACHQIHTPNVEQKFLGSNLNDNNRNPIVGLYIRSEKMFMRCDELPRIQIKHKGENVNVAEDGTTWLCIQCHAPNAWHEAGTNDDRTPIGIYEGTGCIECHDPHSNRIRHSIKQKYSLFLNEKTRCISSPNNDVCSVVQQEDN